MVKTCIASLDSCAKMDHIAAQFRDLLNHFMQIIEAAVDGLIETDPSKANAVEDNGEYLFAIKVGDTGLHKLSRDLLRLIRQPFERELEVVPEGGLLVPNLRHTMVSAMEAAMGTPLEWSRELQSYREELREQDLNMDEPELSSIDVMSELSPGKFVDAEGDTVWSPWTPRPY
jgi:hypothetical protein